MRFINRLLKKFNKFLASQIGISEYFSEKATTYFLAFVNWHGDGTAVGMAQSNMAPFLPCNFKTGFF